MINKIEVKYRDLFAGKPLLVRSPGRVNFIGEHTDYNEGFVLPAAINKAIYFAIGASGSETCRLFAVDMKQEFSFDLNNIDHSHLGWPNYLMGVADQLQKASYPIRGFNCVFGGDIPIGAGLSSSAAVEAGLMFALNELFALSIEKENIVRLAQKAENEFVGVNCGIMDQFINIFGSSQNVLKLDCRSLEFEYYPFAFDDIDIVLCDTRVSHSLASSEYNIRREQCEQGVKILSQAGEKVKSLRDVCADMLGAYENKLDPVIYKRCRYVISENDRLTQGCQDLQKNNLHAFGEKMYETHAGLRDDYEVSCPELDYLVSETEHDKQVLGARMMGGGFGGCTINLVNRSHTEEFSKRISKSYQRIMKKNLPIYITRIENGTSLIES
jgi:galactokinase